MMLTLLQRAALAILAHGPQPRTSLDKLLYLVEREHVARTGERCLDAKWIKSDTGVYLAHADDLVRGPLFDASLIVSYRELQPDETLPLILRIEDRRAIEHWRQDPKLPPDLTACVAAVAAEHGGKSARELTTVVKTCPAWEAASFLGPPVDVTMVASTPMPC